MARQIGSKTARTATVAVVVALGAWLLASLTCAAGAAPAGGVDLHHVALSQSVVATGFTQPDGIVNAHDGSGRLFVVEQGGLIKVVRSGVAQPAPYLDLRSAIDTRTLERGLESIVFSPNFASTGRLYVYYTTPSSFDVLERITVSDPTSDAPTIARRRVVLAVKKSTPWHHGGGMAFGPDGYLYLGIGDGGPLKPVSMHAQKHDILLGKVLRIDTGDRPGAAPFDGTYRIPKSNPFYKKKGYRKEIWALGFRNPWRLTFDSATGDLWIADVGHETYEEVDFQKAGSKGGQNYGWPYFEANHRFWKSKIAKKGFTFPISEYKHPYGECIVGGYVYRGSASPALWGTYLYSDWEMGWINGIRRTTPTGALLKKPQGLRLATTGTDPSAFGVDEAGEPYFVDWLGGGLYRITATTK